MRHAQRSIAHLARFFAEDGAQQALFGRELGLPLGGDFAHEDIVGADFRADTHDAVFVQILERIVADIGDVARDLLFAQLGIARFRLVLLNVDGGEHVVLHQLFGDEDGVLVVVALPLHEADKDIFAERELAAPGGGTVCDDLALCHPVPRRDDGTLIEAGALVGALELL